jgi:hypothetical protein
MTSSVLVGGVVVPSYPDLALAQALLDESTFDGSLVSKLFETYIKGPEYRSLYLLANETPGLDLATAQRVAAADIKKLHALAQTTLSQSAIADGIATEAQLQRIMTQAESWIAPMVTLESDCSLDVIDWFFERGPLELERVRARRTTQFARWLETFACEHELVPLQLDDATDGEAVSPRADPTREGLAYNYTILERIASTASSVVYRGRHIPTRASVALKVVPRSGADPRMLQMFRREVWLTLRARSESVVRVFDFGANKDYYFLALELLHGENLSQKLNRETRLPAAEALGFAKQVATSLGEIHRAGLVHGDIKPLNIFLCEGGAVKLIDFGCATEAAGDASRGMGSPPYIAPEQGCGNAEGRPQPLDRRSDLYALGVTLFHMLTGTLPITNKSLENFWKWQVEADVPHVSTLEPTIPRPIADITFRLTRKEPEARFQDAEELLRALEACSSN